MIFSSGTVGNQCEFNKTEMSDLAIVLKKHIDGDQKLEVQALYALQHLMHRLEHPNSKSRLVKQHEVCS